jgi:hypothetical protein
MTELEKYELVNKTTNLYELSQVIPIVLKDIKSQEQIDSFAHNALHYQYRPKNSLTRVYGIRQQAIYLELFNKWYPFIIRIGAVKGKYSEVLINSNKPFETLEVAYKEAVDKTGVDFCKEICNSVNQDTIPKKLFSKLNVYLNEYILHVDSYNEPADEGLTPLQYANLFVDFINMNSDIHLYIPDNHSTPVFNKEMGIGLFDK